MEKRERLKILRVLSGMSQKDLADAIGSKQASIASYEKGAYGIPEGITHRLARTLNVSPSYLTFGEVLPTGCVWYPDYFEGKSVIQVLQSLLPAFLVENSFDGCSFSLSCTDGDIVLLTSKDFQRKCLLYLGEATQELRPVLAKHTTKLATLGVSGKSMRRSEIFLFDGLVLKNDEFLWPINLWFRKYSRDLRAVMPFLTGRLIPDIIKDAGGEMSEKHHRDAVHKLLDGVDETLSTSNSNGLGSRKVYE